MKKEIFVLLFLVTTILSAYSKDLNKYEVGDVPYFKISAAFRDINDLDYTSYLSSEIASIIIPELSDETWNDLVTKKSQIKFKLFIDWEGNIYGLINRSINIPESIQKRIIKGIENNDFFIPINTVLLDKRFVKTRETLDKSMMYMPLSFNPKSMMKYSKLSPYYGKDIPDSLITKDAIINLSKEILATPLKENHDFDSLMNPNPKKEDVLKY